MVITWDIYWRPFQKAGLFIFTLFLFISLIKSSLLQCRLFLNLWSLTSVAFNTAIAECLVFSLPTLSLTLISIVINLVGSIQYLFQWFHCWNSFYQFFNCWIFFNGLFNIFWDIFFNDFRGHLHLQWVTNSFYWQVSHCQQKELITHWRWRCPL